MTRSPGNLARRAQLSERRSVASATDASAR